MTKHKYKYITNDILDIKNIPLFNELAMSILSDTYKELNYEIVSDVISDTWIYLYDWYNPSKNKSPFTFIKCNLINRYEKKTNSKYWKTATVPIEDVSPFDFIHEFSVDEDILVECMRDIAQEIDSESRSDSKIKTVNVLYYRIQGYSLDAIAQILDTNKSVIKRKLDNLKEKCIENGLIDL